MRPQARTASLLAALMVLSGAACSPEPQAQPTRSAEVLLLLPGSGPVHGATVEVAAALEAIAADAGFGVARQPLSIPVLESSLARVHVVIFVHTAGEEASPSTRRELRRFVEAGGGAAVIHAPILPAHDWGTARRWMGIRRAEHGELRTRFISAAGGSIADEVESGWHRLSALSDGSEVVARSEDNEPIGWRRNIAKGRVFVTDLGHDAASLAGDVAQRTIRSGFEWAAVSEPLEYTSASLPVGSYSREVLATNVQEPIALALLPGGAVLFTERRGALKVYEPGAAQASVAARLSVDSSGESGLLGLALDPSFSETGWLYLLATRAQEAGAPRRHRVSRFTYNASSQVLDLSSEKILIEIPLEPAGADHVGGALAMSARGELFIAIGDDTLIEASDGFAPLDTRPGRAAYDAARSAGNSNDLRGKVLRVRPTANGGLELPTDNLFGPESRYAGQGRPEIYAMGFRNPFTLALDPKSGDLYVGGPGPDASRADPVRGPAGVDEVNRIESGALANFGWPFFAGAGLAYVGTTGDPQSPSAPRNDSPNNTGSRVLPPALAPLLAYGYKTSREFPELGQGPRSVWVGGVSDRPARGEGRRLLLGDFMRKTLHWADFDAEGRLERVERISPGTRWNDPIHAALAADGSVYVLEYGAGWYSSNSDAQLSRLIRVEPGPERVAKSAAVERPSVDIRVSPNRSFFGGGKTSYEVRTEGTGAETAVSVRAVASFDAVRARRADDAAGMWTRNGCAGCHVNSGTEKASAPTRDALISRYAGADASTLKRLVEKVRIGGAGSFGDRAMPPHPGLDRATRRDLVYSLLALDTGSESTQKLPLAGAVMVPAMEKVKSIWPRGVADSRVLLLRAKRGEASSELTLRASHFPANGYDEAAAAERTAVSGFGDGLVPRAEGAWLRYAALDLHSFQKISLWFVGAAEATGAHVELHLDAPDGVQVGERAVLELVADGLTEAEFDIGAALRDASEARDLYVVFRNGRARAEYVLLSLDFH